MDSNLAREIRKRMEAKATEELLEIWEENDRARYSDEAFEAIREVLLRRGVAVPEQRDPYYVAEERVHLIVPKASVKPGFSDWNVIITNKRILFGKVGTPWFFGLIFSVMVELVIAILFRALIVGGVVFFLITYLGRAVGRALEDPHKHDRMSPSEILRMNTENFSWRFEDIQSVKLRKKSLQMVVSIGGKRKRRTVRFSKRYGQSVGQLLAELIPDKLR